MSGKRRSTAAKLAATTRFLAETFVVREALKRMEDTMPRG
jgi:hypothetical protein